MNRGLLLLLIVALVWGTTFPIIRATSTQLSGVEISVLRFLIAGLCMAPFVFKASRRTWKDGALLGVVALVSYVSQASGLEHISSNRSAFLTSINVLIVPLLSLSIGGRLSLQVMTAAALACVGIALMSWDGHGDLYGDAVTILCAFAYAIYIILLSRRSQLHDAVSLAATQISTMALIGLLWLGVDGLRTDAIATLSSRLQNVWPAILYLGVIATAAMLLLQTVAQREVSAEKAALVFVLEPVFAALFGWWWLGESMSIREVAGGAIVIAAVTLAEWRFTRVAF